MKFVDDIMVTLGITACVLALTYGTFFALTKETCDEGQTQVSYRVPAADTRYDSIKQSCVPAQDAIAFLDRQREAAR